MPKHLAMRGFSAMAKPPVITVISTFAADTLIDAATGRREEKPGGPAYWIGKTYERLGIPHRFITGTARTTVEMEILNGEPGPGKMITQGSRIVIDEPLSSDGFLVNILDDFDIEQILRLDGVTALDIAGYTRAGPFLQQRKPPSVPAAAVRERLSIIKANNEEYGLMPESWRAEQAAQRVLLHTRGSAGVDLHVRGRLHHFESPCARPKTVIGAGDTLGASFLAHFLLLERDAAEACRAALADLCELLEGKWL